MGIIRAAGQAVSGALADQWLEGIEAEGMGERTVFAASAQRSEPEGKQPYSIERLGDSCL